MSPEADKVGSDTLEIQWYLERKEEELVFSITDWISAAGKEITNPEFAGFLLDNDCVHLVAGAGGDKKLFAFGGENWDSNPRLYQINEIKKIKLPFFSLTQIFDSPFDYFVDWRGKAGKKDYLKGQSLYRKTRGIFNRKEVLVINYLVMGLGLGEKAGYLSTNDGLLLLDSFQDQDQEGEQTVKKRLNALIPDKQIYPLLLDGLRRAQNVSINRQPIFQ